MGGVWNAGGTGLVPVSTDSCLRAITTRGIWGLEISKGSARGLHYPPSDPGVKGNLTYTGGQGHTHTHTHTF